MGRKKWVTRELIFLVEFRVVPRINPLSVLEAEGAFVFVSVSLLTVVIRNLFL